MKAELKLIDAEPPKEKPVWILQRQPNPEKGETYIQIWFKDDAMKISSHALAKELGDVMQSETINVKNKEV